MPVSIPVEVMPVLESLGIVDAANARWRRAEPWPLRRTRAHVYCDCKAPGPQSGGEGNSANGEKGGATAPKGQEGADALPPGVALHSTRVELAFTWLGNRRVFIGQCPHCRTVVWRDAVSEERG